MFLLHTDQVDGATTSLTGESSEQHKQAADGWR